MLWHVQYVFLVCGTTRSFLNTDLMDGLLTPEGEYCVDIADLQTKATFLIELSTCIDELGKNTHISTILINILTDWSFQRLIMHKWKLK